MGTAAAVACGQNSCAVEGRCVLQPGEGPWGTGWTAGRAIRAAGTNKVEGALTSLKQWSVRQATLPFFQRAASPRCGDGSAPAIVCQLIRPGGRRGAGFRP